MKIKALPILIALAAAVACEEVVQTPPDLRDVTIKVSSKAGYNYLSQGSISYFANSRWNEASVEGNSFTASVGPQDETVAVVAGARQTKIDVSSEQKKFYLDSQKDFEAGMAAYGEAKVGATEGEVELTALTAGLRIHLYDSRHYALDEKVKSVTFTAERNDVKVCGLIDCSGGADAMATNKCSNRVTVNWIESDPAKSLKVLAKGSHDKLGMVVLPFGSAKGKFTVVTDRFTYEFTSEVRADAGRITDVELDFSAPDTQPVRKVGILGDSISTFAGFIDPSYSAFYPANDAVAKGGTGTVQSVEKTYWWKIVNEKMKHGELDIVNSYSGTKVITEGGVKGFVDRAYRFNDPDIIIIHGGTNDMNQKSSIGSYDWDLPIGQLNENLYRSAYIKLIKMLQNRYPGVQIIIVVGDRLSYYECYSPDPNYPYATSTIEIAKHFGLPYVDFTSNGTSYNSLPKSTGSHPDANGMQAMADQIYSTCIDYLP